MREIKFRFFNKSENRMEMSMHCDPKLLPIAEDDVYTFKLFADFYEIMQHTGLKDRNSVDIYEGDIVKTEYGIESIEYYENGFYFGNPLHDNWNAEDVEVIGNIYENPELLKGAKP